MDIEQIVKSNIDLAGYSFENLVYCARICDQIEQFDWMMIYVDEVISRCQALNFDEWNMVSVAFKNNVGPARTSWRISDSICRRETGKNPLASNSSQIECAKRIKKQCEKRVVKLCKEILDRLENKIMKVESDVHAQIFYLKMQGDYYWYIAEVQIDSVATDDEKWELNSVKMAKTSYEKATTMAYANLTTTDPVRLGLDLNFSVFFYEILKDAKKACEIAKLSFDNAIYEIENIADDHYKDTTTIMQLMRDNLNLWSAEIEEGLNSSSGEDAEM